MYDPRWDDLREHDDGRARVYDERDRADHDRLGHLRAEGLVEAVDLGGDERGVVLTKEGRDLLDSQTLVELLSLFE